MAPGIAVVNHRVLVFPVEEISPRGRSEAELTPAGDDVVLKSGLRGLESKAAVFTGL